MPGDALDVFVSYSHEDQSLRQELEEQLVRLRREGLVGSWHERRLIGGEEWRGWVDGNLISADLILLLVSEPFLASGYCRESEIKHALARHASEDAKVIPIIVRPCDWRGEPFAELTTLPQGVGPVTEWRSHEDAWEDIVHGIHEIAGRLEAAREAAPLPSREQTGEYRIAMLAPSRKADPAATATEGESETRSTRLAVLAGIAVALAAVFVVRYFSGWRSGEPEESAVPIPVAEASRAETRPAAAAEGPESLAVTGVRSPAPPAATGPGAEEVAAAPPEVSSTDRDVLDQAPGEDLPPEPAPAESPPAAAAAPAEPAEAEPAAEPEPPQDLRRALGILAAAGAEGDGECLAVLVAADRALTSRACAQSSSVVVMGGNALTATRDEIFDVEPWPSSRASEIGIVGLFQDLADSYGFAATRLAEDFDLDRLAAYYVESSEIQPVDCVAQADLTEWDGSGRAYVENVTFDRYAVFVEAAAEEVISIAGSQWAELLPEMISSAGESLGGYVCALPRRPPGNVVFAAEGRVAGIGYPCEPFDRLETEVRDSLPAEVRTLDLDCIASVAEIRD